MTDEKALFRHIFKLFFLYEFSYRMILIQSSEYRTTLISKLCIIYLISLGFVNFYSWIHPYLFKINLLLKKKTIYQGIQLSSYFNHLLHPLTSLPTTHYPYPIHPIPSHLVRRVQNMTVIIGFYFYLSCQFRVSFLGRYAVSII